MPFQVKFERCYGRLPSLAVCRLAVCPVQVLEAGERRVQAIMDFDHTRCPRKQQFSTENRTQKSEISIQNEPGTPPPETPS